MTWYGVLFWVWLVVSTAVFVVRRFRAAAARRQARAAALAPVVPAAAPPPVSVAATAVPAPAPASVAGVVPQPASTETVTPASSGLPSIAEIRSLQQRTVLTVLEGVRLPCDLYPVTAENGDLTAARRVVAATTGHGAGEVASSLADELERLGFEVRGVSGHQAIATGPRGALHLTVHAGNAPFASVPDHAVVVEIALI